MREVAPEAPMYRVFTMAGLARDSMSRLSFTMLTLGIAASLGVRMALGARAEQVQWMVVAQGTRVVAVGVVTGLAVAIAATRTLGSLLFGVAAIDVPTFAGMAASMIAVGLLASYLPARRASSIDPIESLRGN